MLKRLVNNDIILKEYKASPGRTKWWFSECRSTDILVELVKRYGAIAKESVKNRPLISSAVRGDKRGLLIKLNREEAEERKKDIAYWLPLRKELEALRHQILSRPLGTRPLGT